MRLLPPRSSSGKKSEGDGDGDDDDSHYRAPVVVPGLLAQTGTLDASV